MPDAFELPRVLRAVVPLVRRERLAGLRTRIVDKLVALALGHAVGGRGRLTGRCSRLVPALAPVVGALDDLPKPATGLRRVDPVRIHRRSFHVIDFPTAEQRPRHRPVLTFAVGREDEGALAGADQDSYSTHSFFLSDFPEMLAGEHPAPWF